MSGDYWEDRIRESNDYLDRRYDQRIFDEDLTTRSNEVWRGILDHDPARARRALGIPDPDTSPDTADPPPVGAGGGSAETTTAWPTHDFVERLAELFDNVQAAPRRARFHLDPPDEDGDVLVWAVLTDPLMDTPLADMWTSMRGGVPFRRELGKFWVRACLLANRSSAVTTVERLLSLIRELPDP